MAKKLPASLMNTIPSEYFPEKEQFEELQFTEPVTSIRINPTKNSVSFEENTPVPWCQWGVYLNSRPIFVADPLWHAGAYYVQEASSMFLEFAVKQLVEVSNPIKVLDLCAAPGGKTTLLASILHPDSLLIANEVIQSRASILVENVTKWGNMNVWVANSDPKQFGKLDSFFDLLVIDAPCSGSGLFRRIPSYMDEWTMENVLLCSQRQKRILHDSYASLATNGLLVYMTCSFSTQENEEMVDYILHEFDVESISLNVPFEWNIVQSRSVQNGGFGYRFYPHLLKGEGFFLACFRKKDGHSSMDFPNSTPKTKGVDSLTSFLNVQDKWILEQGDFRIAISSIHKSHLEFLHSQIKLVKKGILVGKMIRNELIPDHELAMSPECIYNNRIELTLKQAIDFLKKNEFVTEVHQKGWYLVTYKGHPLGWIKHLGKRINNYYPSNYRILSKNILPSA